MKMFMASLEGKARCWYEKLSPSSLYSLKDFHSIFFEKYKDSYPYLLLVENCCKYVEIFIQHMENLYDDEEFMNEEILEAFYENSFQHQKEIEENNYHDIQVNFQQTEASPLAENEVDQHLDEDNYVSSIEFSSNVQYVCSLELD